MDNTNKSLFPPANDAITEINTQLFETNLRLNEINEYLEINYSEIKEYTAHLEEQIEELKADREFFSKILDNIDEAIEIVDEKFIIKFQNKLSIENLGNVVGKKCYQVFPGFQEILYAKGNENTKVIPFSDLNILLLIHPRKNKSRNLTDEQFFSNFSHEIRSPLTSIFAAAKIIQKHGLNNSDVINKFTTIIFNECNRLDNYIENIVSANVANSKMKSLPIKNKRDTNHSRNKVKKILHIDDDKNILDIVKYQLKSKKFHVIGDTNADNTISLAIKNKPDLIIIDIMMPKINGYELLTKLKNTPETESIPVLVLSVSNNKEKSIKSGAAGHLTKPINEDILAAEIERILNDGH